jgi:hypothetical protein
MNDIKKILQKEGLKHKINILQTLLKHYEKELKKLENKYQNDDDEDRCKRCGRKEFSCYCLS